MSASKKTPLKNWGLFLAVCLSFLLLARFVFAVREVTCSAKSDQQELDLLCQQLKQRFKNRSIFFYNFQEDQIWDELLEKSDYSQVYQLRELTKTLPGQLNLDLLSKLPDYRFKYLAANGETKSFLLNQNNKLKTDSAQLELFSIFYQAEEELVDKNETYLNFAQHQQFLKIKSAIETFNIPARELIWQNDGLLKLDVGKSWLVVLDAQLDFEQKMAELSFLLKDEAILEKIHGHQYVDMRFRLPVVRDQL